MCAHYSAEGCRRRGAALGRQTRKLTWLIYDRNSPLGMLHWRYARAGCRRRLRRQNYLLLYPFVAGAELDDRVISAVIDLLAGQAPMPVQFAECYRHGGFVALRPDPIDRLQELMSKAYLRWPDVVPYGGAYQDVEPHT